MNADRLLEHYERIADTPDAIARLRRFVLDLAVRGKLVPQDVNDEPASELLKRIAKEKARSAGRNKTLTTIEDEEKPFVAPPSWHWVRMGNVFSIRTGFAFKSSTYADKGTLVFRVTNFDRDGSFDLSDAVFFPTEKIDAKMSGFLMEPGEIIMVMVGGTIGKTTIVNESILPALLNQNMWRIRSFGGTMSSKFEYLLIKNINQSIQGLTQSTHGHFAMSDYEKRVFPLPPLAEQHRIVAKVEELMALCDRLEAARAEREARRDRLAAASLARLNAPDPETFSDDARFALDALPALTARPDQIKQLRQTIINLAVRGKLVPQDPNDEPATELLKRIAKEKGRLGIKPVLLPLKEDEIPFELPAGWSWSRIGEICSKTGSGSTPRGGKEAYKEAGIPFLRSQNVYDDGLRLNDVAYIDPATHERMAGTRVLPGDLLLNITGGSIGRCCRVPDDFSEANVSQHVAIIRAALKGMEDFLHRLVLSPHFQAFIFGEQTGAGRGGLPKNRMDRIAVALPPLAEQHRIVAKVDALMALCDRLEASLTATAATRRRLLDALLAEALAPADAREMEAAE